MNHIQRRQFLVTAVALWVAPIAAQAQLATKPYRIGVLGLTIPQSLLVRADQVIQ